MTSMLATSHGGKSVSKIASMVVTFPIAVPLLFFIFVIGYPVMVLAVCGTRIWQFLKKGVIHWFELVDRWDRW